MKFYNNSSYGHSAYVVKILLVMKLTIVLLTIVGLQITLAADAQRITLSEKNAPLEKILKQIRMQSGFDYFGDIELIKNAKKIDIQVKDVSLEEALKHCFLNQNLTYLLDNKIIVIREKQQNFNNLAKSIEITGKVTDEKGLPLKGATVTIKESKKSVLTDERGIYKLNVNPADILIISYVGYDKKEIKAMDISPTTIFLTSLSPSLNKLKQIEVVSTGYQDLIKERSPGSFELISKEQLQHSTDPNLIKRLEGITTSMDFNNQNQANLSSNTVRRPPLLNLTIRGRNTLIPVGSGLDLSSNSGQPLVVIDGIATPYRIDDLNPNDVENITILKDAAASSIWGSRASNGVIVIKTKKGSFNKPVSISFNSNLMVTDKVDLFYRNVMTTSDFIDAQILSYKSKYAPNDPNAFLPDPDPTNLIGPQLPLSPVGEIMNDLKMNKITNAQANELLDGLRKNDVRRDLEQYFLRKAIIQSYSLGFDGGANSFTYRLSGGYDRTKSNTVTSDGNRYTFNFNSSVKVLKNLTLQAILGYNQTNSTDQAGGARIVGNSQTNGFDPYTRLADDEGRPLSVIRNYRPKYLQLLKEAYGTKILDMTYRPLEDMKQGYFKLKRESFNINMNANYKISPVFNASVTYSYNRGLDQQKELRGANSFYMRELINTFTTAPDYSDPIFGPQPFKKLIPEGAMFSPVLTNSNSQTLRGQINADKTWNEKHELSVIAGIDVNQFYSLSRGQQFYGYDEKTLMSNSNVPFGMFFIRLIADPVSGLSIGQIPSSSNYFTDFKSRTFSLYSNANYTFDKRYTLSASLRNDASSLFGQGTNKKGAPYYSVGAGWNISNERFYALTSLPYLKLRGSFGYNGNVNAIVSSKPLLGYNAALTTGNLLPFATTSFITNPELRPEKSGIINIGLDFGLKNNRLTGSVEYYVRKTKDLITSAGLDPSTGYSSQNFNAGSMRSYGTDITLNSINLQTGLFRWTSNLLFSHNRVKITKLYSATANTAIKFVGSAFMEGYDVSRLAAYRWAGLDPQTGDPMGYVNGVPTRITGDNAVFDALNNSPLSTSTRYFGSAVPVYYGAFRNTFNYSNFSLSVNFLYKFGYYTRRPLPEIMRYDLLVNSNILGAGEYANRWKQPGDENITNVPSFTFPTNDNRDLFYQNSEINVIKGDHIRFQEINLSYTIRNRNWIIKNPRVYANVNNLGIIWRANKLKIDPEASDYPQPRTYSFGLSANF